jgi:hypothetical protein
MALALPGSSSLFSALQLGLKHANKHQVHITKHIHNHFDDFEHITCSIATWPTQLMELFPDLQADVLGTVDVVKAGMGGVMFMANHGPVLWWVPFLKEIQRLVMSFNNPHGALTNSDLKQTGVLGKLAIMAQCFVVCE